MSLHHDKCKIVIRCDQYFIMLTWNSQVFQLICRIHCSYRLHCPLSETCQQSRILKYNFSSYYVFFCSLILLINIDMNIKCLSNQTWAVTELSIELLIGIPSWLMTIVPITFFVSWILFKVSFTSPAKMICCPLLAALLRNAYNIY